MSLSLFANATFDLHYTPRHGEEPATFAVDGMGEDTFTVRCIDFWEAQELLTEKDRKVAVRRTLEMGLVKINGSEETAKKFIEGPKASLVMPLYNAITEIYLGN